MKNEPTTSHYGRLIFDGSRTSVQEFFHEVHYAEALSSKFPLDDDDDALLE